MDNPAATTPVTQQPAPGASQHSTTTTTTETTRKDVQGDEMWTHEFFSCLGDWKLCCATFCCPCYTMGRNAQAFEEECLMIGGLYMLGCGLGFGPVLRWRLRKSKNIRGSMLGDVLSHFLCPCCSLIQENKEIYGFEGRHVGEKIPLSVKATIAANRQ